MTMKLFRVGTQPEAVYQSRDGMYQLTISSDHDEFETLPLFLEFSMSWDRLAIPDQAFLYVLAERWKNGEQTPKEEPA
jgi:hypothetical protein